MPKSGEQDAVRILLFGEEALVRAALQALLETWPSFVVIGEAASKDVVLAELRRLEPHVILLSLNGSEDSDLKFVQEIADAADGRARLLVLAGDCDLDFRLEVIRSGARGVVLKKRPANELQKAIQTISSTDEIWIERTALANLLTHSRRKQSNPQDSLAQLSQREREVVALVTKGLKNKEIGERLFISETTVRHHLTTIFSKLNVSSRFELIAFVHSKAPSFVARR